MKNLIMKSTLLLGVAVLTAAGMNAQGMKVQIPFAFEANGATLPAGEYSVHRTSDSNGGIYSMRNRDTNEGVLLMGKSTISYSPQGPAKLVFRQGVEGYFLTEVWDSDVARTIANPRGKSAILAANKSATRVVIAAHK